MWPPWRPDLTAGRLGWGDWHLVVGPCYPRVSSAGGNNSVVECDLAKVEVAGSNPVSRSNLHPHDASLRFADALS